MFWPYALACTLRVRFIRQRNTLSLCAGFHFFVMFFAEGFTLLFCFECTHLVAIFVSFLFGHQLTTVNAFLILNLKLGLYLRLSFGVDPILDLIGSPTLSGECHGHAAYCEG